MRASKPNVNNSLSFSLSEFELPKAIRRSERVVAVYPLSVGEELSKTRLGRGQKERFRRSCAMCYVTTEHGRSEMKFRIIMLVRTVYFFFFFLFSLEPSAWSRGRERNTTWAQEQTPSNLFTPTLLGASIYMYIPSEQYSIVISQRKSGEFIVPV